MASKNRRAPLQECPGEAQASQSVAGEEDPGAALDYVPAGGTGGGPGTQVKLTNAELVQLQLRVIALENLVTALLAGAPPETDGLARAIAANILPRPGRTPHHLTIRGAAQMVHLLERAQVSKNCRFGDR